jgi:hypothetical protein
MANSAYNVISTQTLGTATSSVTFTSIPQTYTDLVLVVNHSTTGSNPSIVARFNSDTASNYSRTRLAGDGSAVNTNRGSSETTLGLSTYVGSPPTAVGTMICNILNYANSTTYKTCLTRNNAAAYGTEASVTLWRSTASVTSVNVSVDSSTFATGSTFTLYGIKAA